MINVRDTDVTVMQWELLNDAAFVVEGDDCKGGLLYGYLHVVALSKTMDYVECVLQNSVLSMKVGPLLSAVRPALMKPLKKRPKQ